MGQNMAGILLEKFVTRFPGQSRKEFLTQNGYHMILGWNVAKFLT